MEKTKDQLLMEKLRKVTHKLRGGMWMGYNRREPRPDNRVQDARAEAARLGLDLWLNRTCPPFGHGPLGAGHGAGHGHGGMPHGPMPGFGRGALPRERILLIVLEAGEAGIRQRDIAEALGINPSSLSEQIDRLEADRYLERRANPNDRRSTLITLTEKGKARAYEVTDEQQKRADELCGKLTDAEKDTLMQLLDKLLDDKA